jgi:hypothetical protein
MNWGSSDFKMSYQETASTKEKFNKKADLPLSLKELMRPVKF